MARKFTKRVTNNLISITKIGVIAILLATTFSAKAQTTHITSFNQTGLYAATCYINGSPTLTGATITGDITLADGLSIPEFAFNDNTNITSVKALGSIGTIGGWAFSNCNVNTITFGNVTTIESDAFRGCKAGVITFGDVTTISSNAFRNYTSLVSLTFGANPPNVTNSNIFSGCTSLTTIYVPDMYALKKYQKHSFWGSLLPAGVTLEAIDKTPIPRNKTKIGRLNIKRGKVEIKPRD